jgi:RNA polymerase sigma-70 factor (ECF subfamily)
VPESNDTKSQGDSLRDALPKAVAFARSLVRDHEMAEDLVHDCVCRLLARADVYDLRKDGVKLLFRAVTNAAINANRRQTSVVRLYEPQGVQAPTEGSLPDCRQQSPVDQVMTDELRAAIDYAMEALPVSQRAAIQLKSLGHSLAEIAEATGVTANHAGVLVHRARQALRHSLARHLEERA